MGKLILLSFVIATIAIPARASRIPGQRRSFRKLVTWLVVFDAAYLFALLYVYPRFR